jgi:hypothetical protein
MGFYDDIELDEDAHRDESSRATSPLGQSGLLLLAAERAAGGAQLVRWGALGARLDALGDGEREAWALLNLNRMMRRSLASAGIEPSAVLGPLLDRVDGHMSRDDELVTARFLLRILLMPIAHTVGRPEAGVAERLLGRLQLPASDGEAELGADDRRAAEGIAAQVDNVVTWLSVRFRSVDPMFAITDALAAYGAALQGFPVSDLPDNELATASEVALESYRPVAELPAVLELLRAAVPDEGLLAAFDLATGLALAQRMPPAPLLTGLVRRELFRRDLHYPNDLGNLYAALQAALIAAERDLALVGAWRNAGASGRVQLLARSDSFGRGRWRRSPPPAGRVCSPASAGSALAAW